MRNRQRQTWRRPLLVAVCAAVASCAAPGDPQIAPFPIPVDTRAGPFLIGIGTSVEDTPIPATVDTLSPRTIIDSEQIDSQPRRRDVDVAIFSAGPTLADPADAVARALFRNVETLDLHPCGSSSEDRCQVGASDSGSGVEEIQGIVGADVLARGAVRFDVNASAIQFFPDIAGDDRDRTNVMCEAVFAAPFYGGGTLVIAGAEIPYSGQRIAIGACFINEVRETAAFTDICDANPTAESSPENSAFGVHPVPGAQQGLDALFVLSTGVGVTIITESTYDQYYRMRIVQPAPENQPPGWQPELLRPVSELSPITVHLPSGPIEAGEAIVRSVAFVSELSDQRGPCHERYANVLFTCHRQCNSGVSIACPCDSDSEFCRASSVIELDQSFKVAVVPDSEPLIQALRDELRPDLPEISGVLGTNALTALGLDIDYPNNRALMRCNDAFREVDANGKPGCQEWPTILTKEGSPCACFPDGLTENCRQP